MKNDNALKILDNLVARYPALEVCKNDIFSAFELLEKCFSKGHKVLVAGNGGSSADAEHIAGELMKGFCKERPMSASLAKSTKAIDSEIGEKLASKLQQGLPVISLSNHQGLNTAFLNDVKDGGDLLFAEQLLGYGQEGDVFIGISTSGNSKNVLNAAVMAKAKGMKVIGLTGESGGKLKEFADTCIKAPEKETYKIQEYHLPIYHCICLMLEERFF